jgi:hypothetical protein
MYIYIYIGNIENGSTPMPVIGGKNQYNDVRSENVKIAKISTEVKPNVRVSTISSSGGARIGKICHDYVLFLDLLCTDMPYVRHLESRYCNPLLYKKFDSTEHHHDRQKGRSNCYPSPWSQWE